MECQLDRRHLPASPVRGVMIVVVVVVDIAVTAADIVANAIIAIAIVALTAVTQAGDIHHHPCRLKILSNSQHTLAVLSIRLSLKYRQNNVI